jgi:hypothetical protein
VHGMGDIMIPRCPSREETALTNIIIETFQTSEAKTNDRIFFTDLTF